MKSDVFPQVTLDASFMELYWSQTVRTNTAPSSLSTVSSFINELLIFFKIYFVIHFHTSSNVSPEIFVLNENKKKLHFNSKKKMFNFRNLTGHNF